MKNSITCITPVLQAILYFFPDIISFQHVFHLGVGRSQIEWKLKAKTQISVFPWAKIGQNDHSNPYIESTTVLSDKCVIMRILVKLYIAADLAVFPEYTIIIILIITNKNRAAFPIPSPNVFMGRGAHPGPPLAPSPYGDCAAILCGGFAATFMPWP